MVHDGEHWVNVDPAVVPHALRSDHRVAVSGDGEKPYVLVNASPESGERVRARYAAKYGPDQTTVLFRLTDPGLVPHS